MRRRFLATAVTALLAMSIAGIQAAADEPTAGAATEIMEMAEKAEATVAEAGDQAEIMDVMEEVEAVEEAVEAAEAAEEDEGIRSAGTAGNPGEEMVTWILPKSTYELFNLVNEHEPMDETGTTIYNDQIQKSMGANTDLYPTQKEFSDWRAPKGRLIRKTLEDSEFYPGTSHDYLVYVPAAYDPEKPAKLVVFYDGQNFIPKDREYPDLFRVFDNMIAWHDLEPTIVLCVARGVPGPGQPIMGFNEGEVNRSYEYDTVSDWLSRFLTEEIMPLALNGYNISEDPADHVICGFSSSGIAAWTTAWFKPEVFGNVYNGSPTFVNIRGGSIWGSAIRMSEKKPIRVFTSNGKHDLDNIFGSWFVGNYDVALAYEYKGYDYRYYLNEGGHNYKAYMALLPDGLRWLFNGKETKAKNITRWTFPDLVKGEAEGEAAETKGIPVTEEVRSAGTEGNPGEEMVSWTLPKSTYELFNLVNEHEPMDETGTKIYNDQIQKSMGANTDLYPLPEEFEEQGAPKGELITGTLEDSEFYPGTAHDYVVYVPDAYDPEKPARLVVFYDGQGFMPTADNAYPAWFNVLDNMIEGGELDPTIMLCVARGTPGPGQPIMGFNEGEVNRSYEYDTVSDWLSRFLTEEIMPLALKDYNISEDPADHIICGFSSSGIAAWTTAWFKPEVFGNVYNGSPTFVNIRGGNIWGSAIRMSEKKPIRVFTSNGKHDLDNIFGSWFVGNYDVALAYEYKGYDYRYYLNEGGHNYAAYQYMFPEALRWLFKGEESTAANVTLWQFPDLVKGEAGE